MAVKDIVIVGGGLAGATAARTLRTEGFAGPVVVLAEEGHHPYLRPPLSKEYLLGKAGDDALPVVPADWYGENGVELRLGGSGDIDRPGSQDRGPGDGIKVEYAALLLATGARPAPSRCRAADSPASAPSARWRTAGACAAASPRAAATS